MKQTKKLIKEHERNYIHIPFSYRVLWTLIGLTITGFLIFWNWILMINIDQYFYVCKMLNLEAEQNMLELIILYPIIGESFLILLFIIGIFYLFNENNINKFVFGTILGLIVGLICGLIFGTIFGTILGLIVGLICGLIFGTILGLIWGLEE